MTARARHCVFAALLALSAAVVGTAPAIAGGSAPDVQTQAPTADHHRHGRASMASSILAPGRPRTGSSSAPRSPTAPRPTPRAPARVTSPSPSPRSIGGLEPATAYHVRLVASNDRGVTQGADATFTTPASGEPTAAPLPAPAAPSPLPGTELAPAPVAPPVLGRSVTVAPAERHRPRARAGGDQPRGARRRRLGAGRLDRRHTRRHREAAERPARRRDPDRHLPRRPLRGAPARRRPRHDRARAARGAAHVPGRRRARRRGRAAGARRARCGATTATATSAPARATASSPCAAPPGSSRIAATGTLTRVTSGSVAVRDLRTGRTVVVRAGQRHLARRVG